MFNVLRTLLRKNERLKLCCVYDVRSEDFLLSFIDMQEMEFKYRGCFDESFFFFSSIFVGKYE